MDCCSHKEYGCPLFNWFEVFEKKWNSRIVRELYREPRGFNELKAAIPGITQGVLSQRLSELEKQGIICRKVLSRKPIAVEYSLNERVRGMLGCWMPQAQPMLAK